MPNDKAKYAAEREAEGRNQVDPGTPRVKNRHEKMMQGTSSVFIDPAYEDISWHVHKNKK